jgi:hypothetical protein
MHTTINTKLITFFFFKIGQLDRLGASSGHVNENKRSRLEMFHNNYITFEHYLLTKLPAQCFPIPPNTFIMYKNSRKNVTLFRETVGVNYEVMQST